MMSAEYQLHKPPLTNGCLCQVIAQVDKLATCTQYTTTKLQSLWDSSQFWKHKKCVSFFWPDFFQDLDYVVTLWFLCAEGVKDLSLFWLMVNFFHNEVLACGSNLTNKTYMRWQLQRVVSTGSSLQVLPLYIPYTPVPTYHDHTQ